MSTFDEDLKATIAEMSLKPKAAPRGPIGFLRKAEAAKLLNVCTRSLDNWMNDGQLAYYKLGRIVAFKEADLWDFVERCRKPARSESSNDPDQRPPT